MAFSSFHVLSQYYGLGFQLWTLIHMTFLKSLHFSLADYHFIFVKHVKSVILRYDIVAFSFDTGAKVR